MKLPSPKAQSFSRVTVLEIASNTSAADTWATIAAADMPKNAERWAADIHDLLVLTPLSQNSLEFVCHHEYAYWHQCLRTPPLALRGKRCS